MRSCEIAGATPVPSDEPGMRRYERPRDLPPELRVTRYYLFQGGCVTYDFAFRGDAGPGLLLAADIALAFQPRQELVDDIDERTDLRLCGAGAPCDRDE